MATRAWCGVIAAVAAGAASAQVDEPAVDEATPDPFWTTEYVVDGGLRVWTEPIRINRRNRDVRLEGLFGESPAGFIDGGWSGSLRTLAFRRSSRVCSVTGCTVYVIRVMPPEPLETEERRVVWDSAQPGGVPVAPTPPPPAPRLTLLESAELALEQGDRRQGVALLERHLDIDREDFPAQRLLGLILVLEGRGTEGAALVRSAYAADPMLASHPVRASVLVGRETGLRAEGRVMREAGRLGTASAWLSGAVMKQARGETAIAMRLVRRAAGLGLEDEVVEAFELTLAEPARP